MLRAPYRLLHPLNQENAMSRLTVRLIAALCCLLPPLALAAAPAADYSAQYDRCLREAGATNNTSVLSCSESVSASVKKEINKLYARLHAKLLQEAPADADRLEQAQKAWLQYRNGHCDLATTYVGSPMYGYCPMLLNIARVLELRELAGE